MQFWAVVSILISIQVHFPLGEVVCNQECSDYHRICPGLQDLQFYKNHSQQHALGNLDEFGRGVPPHPICNDIFYKYACPRSCKVCIPCETIVMQELQSEASLIGKKYKELRQEANDLKQELENYVRKTNFSHNLKLAGLKEEYDDLLRKNNVLNRVVLTSIVSSSAAEEPFEKLVPISAETSGEKATNAAGTEFGVNLSFDGNTDDEYGSCYYSDKKKNSWVKYSIVPSVVRYVKILPRPSFATAKDYHVYACHEESCTQCGAIGPATPGVFAYVLCPNVFGNFLKIDNPSQVTWITLCEVEIYGTRVNQTAISSAESSGERNDGEPATNGYRFSLDLSYDGNNDIAYGISCYYSKEKQNSWVKYSIAPAIVTSVSLIPRSNRNGLAAASDYHVYVCDDDLCTLCGALGNMKAEKFKSIQCVGNGNVIGIFGNTVKLDSPSQRYWITLCEIEIYGKGMDTLEPLDAETMDGTSDVSLGLSYDGNNNTDDDSCYQFKEAESHWVNYSIGTSMVNFVKVLSGAHNDIYYDVKVCDGRACTLCGTLKASGEFETVQCRGDELVSGTFGTSVKIDVRSSINQNTPIKLCEVVIFGKKLGRVEFAYGSTYTDSNEDLSMDGSEDNEDSCYNSGHQVFYWFQQAFVHYVRVLIPSSAAEIAPDYKVDIWLPSNWSCGAVGPVEKGVFNTVSCGGASAYGLSISSPSENTPVHICEVEAFTEIN